MPRIAANPQDTAILNLNMLMQIEGLYRKDLANHLGRKPQNLSRMMTGESNWAFNDVVRAAEFVGVSLDVLTDPTLTPAKALAIIGERSDTDTDTSEGGLRVAVNSGYRRPRGGVFLTLAA